jgi:hypothetical protein
MINEILNDLEIPHVAIVINTRSGPYQVLVDKEDLPYAEAVSRWVLYKDPNGRPFARADKNDDQVLLHRFLFEIPKGSRLEWINEDTLDCRRKNLQLVHKDGTVEPLKKSETVPPPTVKGVTFHKHAQKWTSRPYWGPKERFNLGYFETREEAVAETLIFLEEGPDSPKLKRNQRKGKN